nr:hypothetical protein BgiMline_030743 [Biomphalaria glabrata]
MGSGSATSILLLSGCILQCISVAYGSRNCDLLNIMDGDTKVSSSELCLAEFVTKECSPFVKSLNTDDLPPDFQGSSFSAVKLSNLNIVGLVNDYFDASNTLYKCPGLRIEWDAPKSDDSYKNVKGYLIHWQYETNIGCRLFHFNSSNTLLLQKVRFYYDIQYLYASGANYIVRAYSILSSEAKGKEEIDNPALMLRSFPMYKYAADPALWSPSVILKTSPKGSIEVKFTLSPPEFELTQFRIQLVKYSYDLNNYYKAQDYHGNLYTPSEPEGVVHFLNLTSDLYSIVLQPIDPFSNIEHQCLCWKTIPHSMCPADQCCENICMMIVTQWFQLNVTEPETQTTQEAADSYPAQVTSASVSRTPSVLIGHSQEREEAKGGHQRGLSLGICWLKKPQKHHYLMCTSLLILRMRHRPYRPKIKL